MKSSSTFFANPSIPRLSQKFFAHIRICLLSTSYVAELSGKSYDTKLRAGIIEKSKRLFGNPDFVYYTIADGVFEILTTVKSGIGRFFVLPQQGGQLFLFSVSEMSRLNFGET